MYVDQFLEYLQRTLTPESASTFAVDFDLLFYFIVTVTALATLLVLTLLIYFTSTYRRRSDNETTPRILGSHRLELFWTLTPLVTFLFMFAWGVKVFNNAMTIPKDAPEIFVVGKKWMWKIQYPGGQRDINKLHLLVDQPVKITVISEDVIHDLGVPAFRQKIDAVPGKYVSTWYHPTKPGTFHLFCDQYCGQGHSNMVGQVIVMEKDEYEQWLSGQAEGSLGLEGRKLFLKLQCLSCHSSNYQAKAPVLEGIWGQRVPLQGGGSAVVDANYVRESILKPTAKIHEGWKPIMPSFKGQVSEEELIQLIAYIRSLKKGQTPVRTEHFPAPVGAPVAPSEGE